MLSILSIGAEQLASQRCISQKLGDCVTIEDTTIENRIDSTRNPQPMASIFSSQGEPPLDAKDVIHGSCLCQRVRYVVKGDPVSFPVCHCVNCRKATGSAFMANIFFKREDVYLTEGHDSLTRYHDTATGSGSPIDRYFCNGCGANLFLSALSMQGKITMVSSGTMDDAIDWVPKLELWAKQRVNWVLGYNLAPWRWASFRW